jgi:hypothetical protein
MVTTVFDPVAEPRVVLRDAKVIENRDTGSHIDHISEAVEIWSRADNKSTGPQRLSQALQCDMAGNRQVLDHLGKEDHVKLARKRRLRLAYVPVNCLYTV